MTTRLIAKEKFFYAGRNVEKDEEFDAEDMDVMLLTHHHTPKATTIELTPQKKKTAPPGEWSSDEKGTPGAKYRTRHLTADSPEPPSEPSSAPGRATPGSAAAKGPKT